MEIDAEYRSIVACTACGKKLRVPDNRGCLEIKCPSCGYIEELEEEEIHLKGGKKLTQDKIRKIIENRVKKLKGYVPRVGVFGVTGVGKSSLCNALFGADVAKISDVAACTRAPQEIHLSSEGASSGIILIDVPGVGERTDRDVEYFELYRKLAPTLDLIIWVIKADDRAYSISETAYKEILKPNLEKCPVLFVINQVDKLPPLRDWNEGKGKPGDKQEESIKKKILEIRDAFGTSEFNIVPVSVEEKYNLPEIVSRVVDILPDEKKYSFAREAKEELRSEEVTSKAEQGVWDSIKKWCGEIWEEHKDTIIDGIKTVAISLVSRIFKRK
ncbi:GTPase family protein [Alcaligenes faecalis]|nr:GTPase [Alcaligenes faecalis]